MIQHITRMYGTYDDGDGDADYTVACPESLIK